MTARRLRIPRSNSAAGRAGTLVGLVFVAIVLLWVAPPSGCQTSVAPNIPNWIEPTSIVKHVDGDTIRVVLEDGTEESVRLIGIDTPESTNKKEPWGREASDFTKSLAPLGARVYLEYDVDARDRYGRLLAYIWLEPTDADGANAVRAKMLNARIALAGLASPLTIQPNSKYANLFAQFVAEARLNGVGMWDLSAQPLPSR